MTEAKCRGTTASILIKEVDIMFEEYMNFDTVEKGLENLKFVTSTRDQMGGALYWNILNDRCIKIADKLYSMGASREQISAILG